MTPRILRHLLIMTPLLLALAGCEQMEAQRVQLSTQERTIAKLREENKQFQDAYYKIKEQLDNTGNQSQKAIDQMTHDLEQARNQRTQKEKELGETLGSRVQEYEAYKKATLDERVKLEAQVATLQQGLQAMTAERDTTAAKLKETADKLVAEQTMTTNLNQQMARLTTDMKKLGDLAAAAKKDLAARETAIKTEQEARAAADQKRTEAETKLAGASKQLTAQGQQLAEQTKKVNSLEEQLKERERQVTEAQNQVADAQKTAESATQSQTTINQLKKDKEALTAELATLKNKAAREASAPKPAAAPASLADDPELKRQAAALQQKLGAGAATRGVKVALDRRGLRLIVPSALLFDENKSNLSGRAAAVLEPIAQSLNQMGERPVSVVGHTDNQAPQDLPYADNWTLGFARADRVREFLMRDGGVEAGRLTALSRAQYEPLTSNETAEGRKQNRRVEIVVGAK